MLWVICTSAFGFVPVHVSPRPLHARTSTSQVSAAASDGESGSLVLEDVLVRLSTDVLRQTDLFRAAATAGGQTDLDAIGNWYAYVIATT